MKYMNDSRPSLYDKLCDKNYDEYVNSRFPFREKLRLALRLKHTAELIIGNNSIRTLNQWDALIRDYEIIELLIAEDMFTPQGFDNEEADTTYSIVLRRLPNWMRRAYERRVRQEAPEYLEKFIRKIDYETQYPALRERYAMQRMYKQNLR